jgi:hypothetical protein
MKINMINHNTLEQELGYHRLSWGSPSNPERKLWNTYDNVNLEPIYFPIFDSTAFMAMCNHFLVMEKLYEKN